MKICHILLLLSAIIPGITQAQESAPKPSTAAADSTAGPTVLPPLFEYPVAPEGLDWEASSNWLVEHFWDNFNPKSGAVPQVQIDHAFRTYIVPVNFASKDAVLKSVNTLLDKVKKNPTLLLQIAVAAEHTIYDPQTADMFIDPVYVPIIKALVSNKKVPSLRKARYEAQLASLENCMTGSTMPTFQYRDRQGTLTSYKNSGVPTIIEFGDYDCSSCRISRLKLEADTKLSKLVEEGKARILFISPDITADDAPAWKEGTERFPATWGVGYAEGLEDSLDLRMIPCIYLISPEGKIVTKAATEDQAINFATTLATTASE